MKAIYGKMLYVINKDLGHGVELIPVAATDSEEILYVGFDDPGLIIDPTDDEVKETEDV